MKKISRKLVLIMVLSALLFLVGSFLFSHFQQSLSPSLGVTHAEGLHDDLVNNRGSSQPWIFEIWKVMLALANVVVIVMLLFVAIVNIVHLQYDTYAIKKSLPLLIIGIVMANFSLLICRMIVDAAQVLTNTFAADARSLIEGYLCTLALGSGGEAAKWYTVLATSFSFIVLIFFGLAILIAVLILAFLLWIRKTAIYLLVALAPLAFIMYAFPPTQGLFKKWWSWFLTWTFMGPLVMLLIWAASKIGATNCGSTGGFSVSAMFAVCGITYLAAIVPSKLGGGVMGAWGKLGAWATGTNKSGYLRKPLDENIQRKKDIAKGAAQTAWGNTRVGQWSDRGRKNEEGLIANYKNRRDTQQDQAMLAASRRHQNWDDDEIRRDRAKKDLQRDKELRNRDFYATDEGRAMINAEIDDQMATGNLTIAKQDRTFEISMERGREISDFKASVANSQMRVEKLEDDQKVVIAAERLSAFQNLPQTLQRANRAVDDAERTLGMVHPDDIAGRGLAEQNLTQARNNLANERQAHIQNLQAQVNPNTGQNYTVQEAQTHTEESLLQQYQVTRYYAIIGKRVNDDSTTDAQSQDSSIIAGTYLDQNNQPTSGTYGPYRWTVNNQVNDIQSFFQGQRLSERGGALGIATGIDSLKKKMTNNRTMGYAMQDYTRMISSGNEQFMNAVVHNARQRMTQAQQNTLNQALQQKGAVATGPNGAFTADDIRQFMANNALDTTSPNGIENRFATNLFGELQRADGNDVVDENGATHHGVTGLGRQAWWYARNL